MERVRVNEKGVHERRREGGSHRHESARVVWRGKREGRRAKTEEEGWIRYDYSRSFFSASDKESTVSLPCRVSALGYGIFRAALRSSWLLDFPN